MMAVLIEGISVVVRTDALRGKVTGGPTALTQIIPTKQYCTDGELIRFGFLNPNDVGFCINALGNRGLRFLRADRATDLVVVDQQTGFTTACDWAEFVHLDIQKPGCIVAACRLAGSLLSEVATPAGWNFEDSMTVKFRFTPNERLQELRYLGTKDNVDEYLDVATGQKLYTSHPLKLDLVGHENGADVFLDPVTGEKRYVERPL